MGRWRAFLTLSNIARFHKLSSNNNSCHLNALLRPWLASKSAKTQIFTSSRGFSAASPFYAAEEIDYQGPHDFVDEHHEEDAEAGKIPIKSYFLCTSINLKSMHAENSRNVVLPTSRSSNYIALKFCNFPSDITGITVEENGSCCRYMVVFHYGSAVLFNVEDPDVESYLDIVRRHASGLLPGMRKDGKVLNLVLLAGGGGSEKFSDTKGSFGSRTTAGYYLAPLLRPWARLYTFVWQSISQPFYSSPLRAKTCEDRWRVS